MMKVNYYLQEQARIQELVAKNERPRLLLHSCCAPCNAYPLQYLHPYFKITIYFNNSNIYPSEEYNIRLVELQKYVDDLNQQGYDFEMIVEPYDYERYEQKLLPLANEREGGARCHLCYALRMDQAYAYANAHHFDYFTSVLTVSRQKSSQVINQIGATLAQKYPNTEYFYSDFKKNAGHAKGSAIAKACNMYRQTYCGCRFSIRKEQV